MDKYTLKVGDNFSYCQNPREPDTHNAGKFASLEEAVAKAKRIVDEFLGGAYREGMTAEELYDSYTTNGKDPHIVDGPTECDFSAWDYAKKRCEEICTKARG